MQDDLMKRIDYANRHARCDGENAAMVWCDYKIGAARCCNCARHFPPKDAEQDRRTVWCSYWKNAKSRNSFCKAWEHFDHCSIYIFPNWINPDTRERWADEERNKT